MLERAEHLRQLLKTPILISGDRATAIEKRASYNLMLAQEVYGLLDWQAIAAASRMTPEQREQLQRFQEGMARYGGAPSQESLEMQRVLERCGVLRSRVPRLAAGGEESAVQSYYPPNQGFLSETTREFLYKGHRFDRYGGSDISRFFSPANTPPVARSLPPGTASQPLRSFEVMKPFEVESGFVAPYFGEICYGLQITTLVELKILLDRGIICEVTP